MLSAAAADDHPQLESAADDEYEPRRWPGVGSGLYTHDKLACVDGWLDILTKMSRGLLQRHSFIPRQYTIIDLNSGPGRYLLGDGKCVDGTPLLIMRRLAASQMHWRAAFVERNAEMARHLEYWLKLEAQRLGLATSQFCVINGDNSVVVLPWVEHSVPPSQGTGLIVHDPNGAPKLQLLEQLTHHQRLKKFDVAVYVQATSLKRVLNLPPNQYDIAGWHPLDGALRRVKAKWVVRMPTGSNQYALCIGSNGELGASWARQNFWPTNSDRGRAILEKLTFTGAERQRRMQPRLFE